METAITAAITSVISAIVGALVAGILTRAKAATGEQRALRDAMRSLLKAELFDLHHRYVELDEPLDAMGLQLAAQCYEVYSEQLHGNGLGSRLYREIEEKGIKGKPKEDTHE